VSTSAGVVWAHFGRIIRTARTQFDMLFVKAAKAAKLSNHPHLDIVRSPATRDALTTQWRLARQLNMAPVRPPCTNTCALVASSHIEPTSLRCNALHNRRCQMPIQICSARCRSMMRRGRVWHTSESKNYTSFLGLYIPPQWHGSRAPGDSIFRK